MQIPGIKGMRREVRRMLAQRSRELLDSYRRARARWSRRAVCCGAS
jgi:hypothetical protein